MIKKFVLLLFLTLILNNCTPASTAFLGPSITAARTGSIYQAGLSYGSSYALKKTKDSFQKIKKTKTVVYEQVGQVHTIIQEKLPNKVVLKNKSDIFFKAVKNNLKKYN
tara:strand:- start:517 stop:843 length:327 start_codon:yes stop_codon:yes gene_type:complete